MFLFSILFLLMTLAAYAAEKSLREHLHGKMTVVFLGNLTICFIVAALSWFQVNCPKEWNVLYSTWFVHMIFPRLLKLTVAAVFYQATSSRSWFWKQRYSYIPIFSFSSISSSHSSSASTPLPSTPICRSA